MQNMEYNYIEGKRVAFLTLGCKVNSYETEAMEELFEKSGAVLVPFEETADIYVVNTCTVTNIADRKSRQMLHRARKNNGEAVVIAVGCYVQAAKEELLKDSAIDLVIGNNRKAEIIAIVNRFYSDKDAYDVLDIAEDGFYEELSISSVKDKTRAYIKIQDGCNQFCSYCIIPYTRGRIRSRNKASVISEVKQLVANGYKEIVLTGIHISSYGFDLKTVKEQASLKAEDNSMPLLSLIMKLHEIDGLERIRFGSLEPRIITEEFVKTLAGLKKVCPHFHLSLQSGCDATLSRMNRKYTTSQFKNCCDILRKYYNNPALTTDIIVGFPQETDAEFAVTKQFLTEIGFAQMHVFAYSKRKGTKAERMEGQVPDQVKHHRSEELIALDKVLRKQYMEKIMKEEQLVLLEEEITVGDKCFITGHNERYVKFALPSLCGQANELKKVKAKGFLREDILLSEIMD